MKNILLYAFMIGFFVSCKSDHDHSKHDTTNHVTNKGASQKMVDELASIANTKQIDVWHQNRPKAEMMEKQLLQTNNPGQRISLLFRSGIEWLKAGDYAKSINNLLSIFTLMEENKLRLPEAQNKMISEMLGVAYLRKAEIENCIANHNEYSCIIPIQKPGQHSNKKGAEAASAIFKQLLDQYPDDDKLKWLYNVTKMTLGEYPNGVEKDYIIPPSVFESDRNIPRFVDKAMELGIAVNDISGSVVMEDFNNDGYLDLLVSSYGLDDQLYYFKNSGEGNFIDKTIDAGLKGIFSGLNMVQADYDNDGFIDVLVLRGAWLGKDGNHPNSLLKNNGDGTFVDVTHDVGLYTKHPTQTASWADYNNDGWIDLFIANEHSKSSNSPCQLFINKGDGTFIDEADKYGLKTSKFIKGCISGDYDNDGDIDIYVSSINSHNILFQNQGESGNFKFEDVTQLAGVKEPMKSFPCWFFDYNQDGNEDLFVSGFDFGQFETASGEVAKDYMGKTTTAEKPVLYQNLGNGTFKDVTKRANVDKVLFTMGCNFGDLDNNGFPDFYAATGTPDFRAVIPNRMFLNGGKGTFLDVTKSGGFGHLQKGHGVAFGDIDNDGDQDVYHVLGGSYDGDNFMNALFTNPGVEDNAYVYLKLEGKTANRCAIGAKVVIVAKNTKGEEKTFYNRVNSGGSFGANSLRIEQGLGNHSEIVSLSVIWPGSLTSENIGKVTSGKMFHIKQGDNTATEQPLNSVTLKGGGHDHHQHH